MHELWFPILTNLKALYEAYYTAHWTAFGEPYYGDHLLYQRLYEGVQEEVDGVAERALGLLRDDAIVNPILLSQGVTEVLQSMFENGVTPTSLLLAEMSFLQVLSSIINQLRSSGVLTDGVEDLLQGIASNHEESVYLLSRRAKADGQALATSISV